MSFAQFIIACIFVVLSLTVTVIPVIYGEIKKLRVNKPIEYFPPRGASPIDILIQYKGALATPREIFNPLMLYWASRGFVKIEEDCKRGLKITKLKNLEPPEVAEGVMTNQMKNNFKIEKEFFDGLFEASIELYTLAAPSSIKNVNKKKNPFKIMKTILAWWHWPLISLLRRQAGRSL